jgi:RNA polymerase sigma factor (sigma-70 family)
MARGPAARNTVPPPHARTWRPAAAGLFILWSRERISLMTDWPRRETLEILNGILESSEDAWQAFQTRYGNWIYGIAIHHFGRSPEDAQEDYQNVVIKLLGSDCRIIRRFLANPETDFHSYLLTVVRSCIIDELRRRKPEAAYDANRDRMNGPAPGAIPDAAENAETALVVDQVVRALYRGISEEEKIIFRLFFFEGRTYKEISAMVGRLFGRAISVNTVGVKISRLRGKLARCARHQGFFEGA